MIKRIDPELKTLHVFDPASIDAAVKELGPSS